jgi:hypothetical protein
MRGALYFFLVVALWVLVQMSIDSKNPCSNFAPSEIAGNCYQDIE